MTLILGREGLHLAEVELIIWDRVGARPFPAWGVKGLGEMLGIRGEGKDVAYSGDRSILGGCGACCRVGQA